MVASTRAAIIGNSNLAPDKAKMPENMLSAAKLFHILLHRVKRSLEASFLVITEPEKKFSINEL